MKDDDFTPLAGSSQPDLRFHPTQVRGPRTIANTRLTTALDAAHADRDTASGGRAVAAVWQSAFSLAPNVRFTRTPESAMPRKHKPTPLIVPPQTQQLENKPEPHVIEHSAAPEAPVVEDAPVVVHPSDTPELPTGSISADPVQPERQTEDRETIIDAYEAPKLDEPADLVTTAAVDGLAYVSDFAFWEYMPLDHQAAIGAASADPVLPAKPIHAPVPTKTVREDEPSESITLKFRVVECRRPSDSPVTPVVEPVAAEPESLVEQATELAEVPELDEAPSDAGEDVVDAALQSEALDMEPCVEDEIVAAVAVTSRVAPRFERPVSVFRVDKPARTFSGETYEFPPLSLLQEAPERSGAIMTQETLEQNAGLLESVLEDFGVRGEIIHVRPGPVVTLYELEPAPGVKSSRVIGLADDIARSMSALSARVAVVPGRNVIGIELPNATRETVYFRELIESDDFVRSNFKLPLCLGKTIGGEPVIAELAKMPHLLVAGTTGSGKSVAINTMILSLLYRLKPEECKLIMVDPKMLELSIYDGIPHLLTPVVTDPKKAVTALKWAVREMEDRYRKMSRLGVRNIDGYNARAALAREKGETVMTTVQTGFEKGTGEALFEQEEMDLTPMPYIVVIVDEMADLMMVAGKEIEGAIQRLAQMARAAGIHLIMATQRPSVDVITGTIKANFPTRISFQVTSKIDSRTILGEQGAEQLLGQGDMLHMAGGGRISRVHGPFVSDEEVEKVVAHLKSQGRPEYLETVTADEEEEPEAEPAGGAVFDKGTVAAEDGNELYDQAIKVVMRDKKCSTSYIQRRLGIGYNRAASLVERMEKEGLVGPANHVGKREIISLNRDTAVPKMVEDDE
ncbi:DNA translocase FtsK [Rhizobium sp. CFBP 8762]|uniref:DNA translocase FtsK n=1 Tax=Rhizobium sp. CFBP 8762 TaxID=2775279 RepID=UPI001780E84B|nr:DNA translocase FtsK [Rhizobium sp. CFBP 8762]MBD8553497.1 DNA translocase FtsK [Rhizobium sp. CFBP 8762]